MKKVYLKIAIAIALCDISVYASQSEGSPDPVVSHAISSVPVEKDEAQLRILEEVESIAKGRYAYNAYLLQEMQKEDESLTIIDRITYYCCRPQIIQQKTTVINFIQNFIEKNLYYQKQD